MTMPKISSLGWKTVWSACKKEGREGYDEQTDIRKKTSPAASMATNMKEIPRTVRWM